MSFHADLLADSVGPHGCRLSTFEVTFPRMVLADMTRHRIFSYSFESTRARPPEVVIESIRNGTCYIPTLLQRAKGMGGGEPWPADILSLKTERWMQAANDAADAAEDLLDCGKEHVGRLLEPFAWITGLVSGTEFENYFSLRCPPPGVEPDPRYPAQVELQVIAKMMEDLYRASTPRELRYGQWHLPLISEEERAQPITMEYPNKLARASAGRCAAVSYKNHHKDQELGPSVERWDHKLAPSAHWSPGEHPAECVPLDAIDQYGHPIGSLGNFTGFKQLRKCYPNESVRPRDLVEV